MNQCFLFLVDYKSQAIFHIVFNNFQITQNFVNLAIQGMRMYDDINEMYRIILATTSINSTVNVDFPIIAKDYGGNILICGMIYYIIQ